MSNNAPDPKAVQGLFELACRAQKASHSPYSNFAVGAAIITNDGEVYVGCNVENASYGLCICAEQVAITKAVSEGRRDFAMIVVVANPLASPCGACRQIIGEFFNDDALIISIDSKDFDSQKIWTMEQLLPDRFSGKDLLK